MKTKRLLTWILVAVLAVLTITFVACVDKPTSQEVTELILPTLAENQMAVIVKNGDKDYTNIVVTLGLGGVMAQNVEDVLNYLDEQGTLKVTWQDSTYGKFIVGIGNAQATKEGEFISILTSVGKDKGNWAGVTTYTVGNVTLVASQFGVSEMSVEPGAVIYFEVDTY